MRQAMITRDTKETQIQCMLTIEGAGEAQPSTGVGFFDHMLTLFSHHGNFDLKLRCKGDLQVDTHHTLEDCGITLGRAFDHALADRRGIHRYGNFLMPMDETLILCAVDISGRPFVNFDVQLPSQSIGTFDTESIQEFFWGFARALGCTLHFKQLSGSNTHHVLEAVFKGFGRALAQAVQPDANNAGKIPSSKGKL